MCPFNSPPNHFFRCVQMNRRVRIGDKENDRRQGNSQVNRTQGNFARVKIVISPPTEESEQHSAQEKNIHPLHCP